MGDGVEGIERRIETEQEVEAEYARRLPAVRAANAVVTRDELSVQDLVAQAGKIREAMGAAMKEDVHYGKIPGVNKPTLLKPGAELLNVLLRLAPSYHSERVFHEGGHLTVVSKCTLTHIPTGMVIAEGEGLCSTYETKYAHRQGKRRCPACNAEAIVRSQKKSAYFCISNEGGCGNRYPFGSPEAAELDKQDVGKVDNPELPDTWNTVLKMADKRALIAACLNGTGASDIFTQDVEDAPATAGGSESQAPVESREFNPAVDVHPKAIQGDGFFDRLGEALKALDTSIDWWRLFTDYGRVDFDESGKTEEFWRRTSNAVARLYDSFDPNELRLPQDEDIQEAFAWAFDGVLVEIHRKAEDELDQAVDAEVVESESAEDAPLSGAAVEEALKGDDDVDF